MLQNLMIIWSPLSYTPTKIQNRLNRSVIQHEAVPSQRACAPGMHGQRGLPARPATDFAVWRRGYTKKTRLESYEAGFLGRHPLSSVSSLRRRFARS
jgi:hypothetical protein